MRSPVSSTTSIYEMMEEESPLHSENGVTEKYNEDEVLTLLLLSLCFSFTSYKIDVPAADDCVYQIERL